jgi:hypothetical protein
MIIYYFHFKKKRKKIKWWLFHKPPLYSPLFIKCGGGEGGPRGSTAELRKKDKFHPAWPKPIVLYLNNKRQGEGA